jgi:hypothetical protein
MYWLDSDIVDFGDTLCYVDAESIIYVVPDIVVADIGPYIYPGSVLPVPSFSDGLRHEGELTQSNIPTRTMNVPIIGTLKIIARFSRGVPTEQQDPKRAERT